MQKLDSFHEIHRERDGGFEYHPAPGVRRSGRSAVETEPRCRFTQRPVTVDEVRYPERIPAQIDRDFAALAQTQELTLDGSDRSEFRVDMHGASWVIAPDASEATNA